MKCNHFFCCLIFYIHFYFHFTAGIWSLIASYTSSLLASIYSRLMFLKSHNPGDAVDHFRLGKLTIYKYVYITEPESAIKFCFFDFIL